MNFFCIKINNTFVHDEKDAANDGEVGEFIMLCDSTWEHINKKENFFGTLHLFYEKVGL